ncbi:UDP-4-amino-4,6-dideoxy-N-acetyl-beta-L-altrosamine N-acetyltransferase [Clostridium sp. ZBS13]|uniref:UDP-4-amino-4, 6-dideoxy-N-acetyl-beta-L-altrosamine N-acetyltransferase n=1 Tax=Clostridium sp. ZBS13 TaxID=2949971 RepID=UPI0020799FA8
MDIELKKMCKDDLEVLMNWRMKPEITKYMYTDPVLNMEKQLKWYKKISDENDSIYWVIHCNNTRIGDVSLHNIDYTNNRCDFAHSIGEDSFRGIGLGAILEYNIYDYVFNQLNLNKICFQVLSFNKRAINLHKKLGANVEGILREHILKNGIYYDVVVMAITKQRWNLINKRIEYDKIYIE